MEQAHQRIRQTNSTEFADAEAHLSNSYCDHHLEPGPNRAALDFRHASLALDRSGFNLLQYGEEVSIASSFENFYMLEMPIEGGVDIHFGAETVQSGTGIALLLSPGPRFVSRWRAGTRQMMLQIDRQALEDRFAALARRPNASHPIFNPVIDLNTEHGRYIRTAFSGLAEALADPEIAAQEDLEAVVPALIDELLQNIAYRQGSSIVPERLHATPRQVKLAIDLFKTRYGERLMMPAVAREIGISERALYEGFQRYYQRSPYDILTRIRMENARRLMRHAGLSAAEAARNVGIRHLGRFSATYRDVFGVLPSQDSAGTH
ncbi:AraC family transcriptional regulator [Rhizobium setariae]|uniref:AraC family transcriptional regulator n=1 Tax=Rhizobium setariae TaxID=2801340 RepID=UPI0031B9D3E2